ncbi:MAG: NADH-quinone oxidoreductase subunit [Frankiales bacterium]|nr:NADH-quinone oxidoreductase subunit [Frankiales bacterium]
MQTPVSVSIGSRESGARERLRVAVAGGVVDLWMSSAGLACCAVEVSAALARLAPADATAVETVVNVLVVSGTVTDKLAPSILHLYAQLPEPRRVVSFGACSNSGGPYWDSYCVTKGVDQMIPVDLYVPGCPPRPEALLDGLRTLVARS